SILEQTRRGEFPRPRQVRATEPAALEAVCLKALALCPEDRYASAMDLAADVEHWLGGEPVSAHREPWPDRLARWGRRHRTLASVSVALLVMATAALALGLAAVNRERSRTAAERDEKERALTAESASRKETRRALNTLTDGAIERLMARQVQL